MSEPLDPAEWPRWFHHVALESVLCATPADVAALPAGFRKEPWSEAAKAMHAAQQREAAEQGRKAELERLEATLEAPVTAKPPPPKAKVLYTRPSRAKAASAQRKR